MSREIHLPAAAVSALASGNRIEAIKLVREANHGVDLRGAMEAVDAHASERPHSPMGVHVAPAFAPANGLPAEAIAAIGRGHLIDAIKMVRQATGLGLKEAKELVDAHRENPGRSSALEVDETLEELARKHGVAIPAAAVDAFNRGNLLEAIKLVRQAGSPGPQQHPPMRERDGSTMVGTARSATTVSMDANRHGWLWALVLLAGFAAAWFWLGR